MTALAIRRRVFWSVAALAMLLPRALPATEELDLEVEAYAGQPLGVGVMRVELPTNRSLPPDAAWLLTDKEGRVLYPAFERTAVHQPLADEKKSPVTVTAYFLFRGDGPLELTLRLVQDCHTAEVKPKSDKQRHQKLLATWWKRYVRSAQAVAESDAYPPLVENYLVSMLGRRLGFTPPEIRSSEYWRHWYSVDEMVSLLTGAESVRVAAQSKVLLARTSAQEAADRPLPKPVDTPPIILPKFDGDVPIEKMAEHVPEECFYLRCGSFKNFTWLRRTMDDWATNIRHITAVRGLDYKIRDRLEKQLALEETVLGKLLGDTVISDVAVIGTDTFVREGAALGILFEARSSTVLKMQLDKMRADARERIQEIKQETVRIADRDVSLLSLPDNSVRSFYAVDGKYHFVTTSKALVRRFFEAGEGHKSLAKLDEFRWGRKKMPLADGHTVFVYLSDPFFRNLIGPHYRIEMTRRVSAASAIDVVRMAHWAAKAEGRKEREVKDLVAAALLPPGFGRRPDDSHVVAAESALTDSLRGAQGTFLPIPDVPITGATASEVAAYEEFSDRYARAWQRMDPVVIGVKRKDLDGGKKERLAIDVHITPYSRQHYDWLAREVAETKDAKRFSDVPGDLVTVQLGPVRELGKQTQRYVISMRDWSPKGVIKDGAVHYSVPEFQNTPVWLAAHFSNKTTRSVLVETWLGIESGKSDGDIEAHRAPFLGGETVWLRKLEQIDLLATNKAMLDLVTPHLKIIDAERPADLRLRVGDLAKTKLSSAINAEFYTRSRRVSAGNVAFLDMLQQQLQVPVKTTQSTALSLLGGEVVCPLGGRYERTEGMGFDTHDRWHSTAWARDYLSQETQVKPGYRAPVFDWFSGLLLEMSIDQTTLSTHIELDVKPK